METGCVWLALSAGNEKHGSLLDSGARELTIDWDDSRKETRPCFSKVRRDRIAYVQKGPQIIFSALSFGVGDLHLAIADAADCAKAACDASRSKVILL